MPLTISELYDWFRGERFAAAHNALYEILVEGAPADTIEAATLLLARIRMNMGDVDAALMQLSRAEMRSVEDRASSEALMALGYSSKRCFGLADEALRRARPAGSAGPFVDLCEAMVRTDRGRLATAAGLLRGCLGDHADRRFACKALAEVLRASGDVEGSRRALDELSRIEDRWAGTHRALAYHALADGRPADAVRHIRRALEEAPDGDFADADRFTLGRAHLLAGDAAEAERTWRSIAAAAEPPALVARALHRLEASGGEGRTRTVDPLPATLAADSPLPPPADVLVRLLGGSGPAPEVDDAAHPWTVLDALSSSGLSARLAEADPDAVRALVDAGLPCLLYNDVAIAGQPALVVGYDDLLAEVRTMDPASGLIGHLPYEALDRPVGGDAALVLAAAPAPEPLDSAGVHGSRHVLCTSEGDALRDAGDARAAEGLYLEALSEAPDHGPAHAGLLAVLLARLGTDTPGEDDALARFDEALETARRQGAPAATVHTYEGRRRLVLGQHGKALSSFEKAARTAPDDVHVICDTAASLLATGAGDEAAGLLAKALGLAPHHPRPNLDLADLHASRADLDAAEHHARCGLDLAPGSPYGHEILGRVHRARGRIEDALAELDRAADLGSDTDWLHAERGACLAELGRDEEAVGELEEVLARDASHPFARTLLVESLVRAGRGEDALSHARTIVSLEPGDALSHETLGLALRAAGRDDEARRAFIDALERQPGRISALRRLGDLVASRGSAADAVSLWLAAARRDPSNPEVLVGLSEALEADGKAEAAQAVLRRAALAGGGPAREKLAELRELGARSADPIEVLEDAARHAGEDRAVILAEMGRMLLLAGDPRAVDAFRRAAELAPTDPSTLAMLAHALHALHRMGEEEDPRVLAQAAEIMDHVLAMEPYWVWARAERGMLALDAGDPREALEAVRPVTEDAPTVWRVRMEASSRLGDHAAAARAADGWLAAAGDGLAPQEVLSAARCHQLAGNAGRAVEIAETVLPHLPEGPSELRSQVETILDSPAVPRTDR